METQLMTHTKFRIEPLKNGRGAISNFRSHHYICEVITFEQRKNLNCVCNFFATFGKNHLNLISQELIEMFMKVGEMTIDYW